MADIVGAKYSMIVTIVSRGYADIVIGAAKDAGARGGTVFYARGSGMHDTEKFIGIPIQPEKEVVLTLVKKEAVKDIVSAITDKAGLTTDGRGISFVLPVTRTAGIVNKEPPKGQAQQQAAQETAGKEKADTADTESAES
ncbi:MAG: P-II family nitrogen regulator [Clostridiales Family XIII bacterium]|jgi:nitrogen regulatory protein PII|nr:P-II family nitrogen regulator [Clostridiales Family XIII bacterium]